MSAQPNTQISSTFASSKTEEAAICNHVRTQPSALDFNHNGRQQGDLLKPASIFCGQEQTETLDRYIKIKMSDMPKDTLAQVMSKKQQFQRYINRPSNQQTQYADSLRQSDHKYPDQSRQMLYEHSFTKHVAGQAILMINVTPSAGNKCNLVLSNLRGEIIKYYPNVFLVKKRGKILKTLKQFSKHCFFIKDACEQGFKAKYFRAFFREHLSFCYSFTFQEYQHTQILNQIQELNQKFGAKVTKTQKNYKIVNFRLQYQRFKSLLPQVEVLFQQRQIQQNEFLERLRGHRQQNERNLSFDFMAVNIWRQSGLQLEMLANKINQLFDLKAESIRNMIPQNSQTDVHVPFRTQKDQNCVSCLSKNLSRTKPKRTYLVCQTCSSKEQKPIYLCRKCFAQYHKNPNIYIFKRNQKIKGRRLIVKKQVAKNRKKKLGKGKKISKLKQEQPEKPGQEQKAQLYNRLNRLQEEFFQKIGQMVEEGQDNNLNSCNFYLSMLLNTNLQFVQKVNQRFRQRQNDT